jgi:hypothetical protein
MKSPNIRMSLTSRGSRRIAALGNRILASTIVAGLFAALTVGAALAADGESGTVAAPTSDNTTATSGVVWLTCEVSGKSRANLKLPLEWLAACDRKGTIKLEDDIPIDAVGLWAEHKDLAVGETREIKRGKDKDGDPYVLHVVSVARQRDRARGKVHIVSLDDKGKKTDIAFPLDIPKLIENIANVFTEFFGTDTVKINVHDLTIGDPADLKKLADYGRFVFLDSVDPDSSAVRITIE